MAANASAQTAAAVPGLDLIAARHERRLTRPPQWLTSLSITVTVLVTWCRPPSDLRHAGVANRDPARLAAEMPDSARLLARAASDAAVGHRALPTWLGGPVGD